MTIMDVVEQVTAFVQRTHWGQVAIVIASLVLVIILIWKQRHIMFWINRTIKKYQACTHRKQELKRFSHEGELHESLNKIHNKEKQKMSAEVQETIRKLRKEEKETIGTTSRRA